MVEDIIYNLVQGIDEEETEKRVKEYERNNLKIITENQFKKTEIERIQQEQIQIEEDHRKKRIIEIQVRETFVEILLIDVEILINRSIFLGGI
jgi:hypothetical protein